MTLAERLHGIQGRIADAAARHGAGSVQLVGVAKRHPESAIVEAYDAGLRDFGENYAQEFRAKAEALADRTDLRWHFIGSLQRNKVKLVIGCALIHTLDRPSLLAEIEKRASDRDLVQDVLIEVNVGETQKGGAPIASVAPLLEAASDCAHVRVRGLMVLPPFGDPVAAERAFGETRRLRDELRTPERPLPELSMGMSADFELAIAAGATIVRVGTAIFGPRPP